MISNAHFSHNKIQLGRFSYLLVSTILILALVPFLEGFFRIKILTDLFLSTMLLSAVYTASEKRRSFIITLVLACSFLILKWSSHLVETPWRWPLAEIFACLLTAYLLIFVLSFIKHQQEVSTEVILEAVCGYFLLGFMWGFFFLMVS